MTTALAAHAASQKLLTAEEYLKLPDNGQRTELRRGVVVTMNPPVFATAKYAATSTTMWTTSCGGRKSAGR